MDTITIDDFFKVEMRVGKVVAATNVEKSEKLIRFVVDFGGLGTRTIFASVRPYGYTPEYFIDKRFLFVTNLLPKKIMGEESQGMTLCVEDSDGKPLFIAADGMPVGAKIR